MIPTGSPHRLFKVISTLVLVGSPQPAGVVFVHEGGGSQSGGRPRSTLINVQGVGRYGAHMENEFFDLWVSISYEPGDFGGFDF